MVSVTEIAARKIQQTLTKRGRGEGIRIGVKATGCSGLAYVLEYVDQAQPDDQCVECLGCKIFIDPKSCPYLAGLTIDYVRNGLNEGFEFQNPNERDRCGCGESFSMKYWTRDDTKEWITQLENRIEDIDYYLNRTLEWCEEYGIYDDKVVFMCSFLTCVWVSHMRGEPITFTELMEMLGVKEWECAEEKIYELDEKYAALDHHELLELTIEKFNEENDE